MARAAPSIEPLRDQLLAVLADCHGLDVDRMRSRVRRAGSAQELWLERSELFQLISRRYCESHAKLILGVSAGHLASTVENF